jgi:hypothetical protein
MTIKTTLRIAAFLPAVSVIKRGVPTTMMPPFDRSIEDADVWNIVNYVRSLTPQR